MTTADTIRLDQLDARIRAVWVREQTLHLLGGLLALCRWAVPLFIVCVLIDWLTYMPAAGRLVMLLVVLGVSAYRAWANGWRRLQPFDAVRTALRLESRQGNLSSLLVSAIQLRNNSSLGGASSPLRDHTCRLAERVAGTLRPSQAVPYRPLRHPGLIALSAVGVIAVFAAVNAAFLGAGLARIFTPWVQIEYPTNTHITLAPDERVVKEGDSAVIEALVGGVVPAQARIYVKTSEGRARAIELPITDGRCEYNIDSASRDFTYRFKAGDDRTDWQTVRVVPSPRLQGVSVQLVYPEYLKRETESVEALTLTVPEGTAITWRLTLDRPISAARLMRDEQEPMDLQVSDDGYQVAFTEDVTASQGYNFQWVERENGFRFASPRYYLQVASDRAPRVELTSPSSHLAAMLGRPLQLAVRAQDDHAIGSTKILYRVNQHHDKTHELEQPVRSGQGEQPIDWDYRTALPDLAIGDTVSFAVEVSDRYPGEQGPHTARTETRRITFLSKEQYLEQIEKQKDRLLSRVQTIYRRQRSAHVAVFELTPRAEGYPQACQLEAIRQEMLRDQLKEIAGQMQTLLDDLAANNVPEAAQEASLEAVGTELLDIADTPISQAADLLRDQSRRDKASGQRSPAEAAYAVNTAARGLAGLVLLRGIDSAQEVYAREARMLARTQANLRWETASCASQTAAQAVAERQNELAQWTDQLISQILAGMCYDKRPLAVLRLTRSVKNLRDAGAGVTMREVSALIQHGNIAEATDLQADLVRRLLNAEFSVRLSGAYSTLLATRDQLRWMTQTQAKLSEQTAGLSGDDRKTQQAALARQQTALRRQLLTLMLPSIPAPRAKLFDRALPQAPPIEQLLTETDNAMVAALSGLKAGDPQSAAAEQQEAGRVLAELTGIVDIWSVEMGLRTRGLGTLVAASSERLSRIETFEVRALDLLEQTDLSAAEEETTSDLAEPQLILSEELDGFCQDLARLYEAEQDPDLPPLLGRLKPAEQAANAAVRALKDNNPDEAIALQEQAADALARAREVVLAQSERLGYLQGLLLFQRSVGLAGGYMADIVAEQRDLLETTEDIKSEDVSAVLPVFNNLRRCMFDVAPLLSMVAGRLDVGTPLAFAQVDFDDAVASLQAGDNLDSIDAQDVAAESLAEVQSRVEHIRLQTGYIAEIVALLHTTTSDAAQLGHQQADLQARAASARPARLPVLAQEQQALLERAERIDRLIDAAVGNPKIAVPVDPTDVLATPSGPQPMFAPVAKPMRDAAKQMAGGNSAAASEQMRRVTEALGKNVQSLLTVIEVLHGLPSIEITTQAKPELVRLVDVLVLASDQKLLNRKAYSANDEAIKALSEQQRALTERCHEIAGAGEPHPLLTAAGQHLDDAVAALDAHSRDALIESQEEAEAHLRHFIAEQAVILDTSIPPPAPSDGEAPDGPGSDSEAAFAAGFISDFVSGETPDDQRSEWQVLGERNRAALNQNFARELPLEYRGLLKDYYERVAQ